MRNNEKFFNKNLVALEITNDEQALLDEIISYATQTYINARSGKPPEGYVALETGKDHVREFFNFGLNLISGGMDPENVRELMESRYQALTTVSGFQPKVGNVWLQLSFVKNAIELLQHDVKQYFRFIGQISSEDVPLDDYYESFQNGGLMEN